MISNNKVYDDLTLVILGTCHIINTKPCLIVVYIKLTNALCINNNCIINGMRLLLYIMFLIYKYLPLNRSELFMNERFHN